MASGRPDLQWAAKVRASAAICLVGAVAGTGLYFVNLAYVRPAFSAPFHVTGAPTLSSAQNGCTVNVTGKIDTNGASGMISYQWVFTPQQGALQPLSQSVVSGQNAVFVTLAVQGQSGHGTATEKVTLQVLGPNQETASRVINISC
jgi:hypothetical protein